MDNYNQDSCLKIQHRILSAMKKYIHSRQDHSDIYQKLQNFGGERGKNVFGQIFWDENFLAPYL